MIIDALPVPPESYVINCLIKRKENDDSCLFTMSMQDGMVTVCLDGYAIIPMEEYDHLVNSA